MNLHFLTTSSYRSTRLLMPFWCYVFFVFFFLLQEGCVVVFDWLYRVKKEPCQGNIVGTKGFHVFNSLTFCNFSFTTWGLVLSWWKIKHFRFAKIGSFYWVQMAKSSRDIYFQTLSNQSIGWFSRMANNRRRKFIRSVIDRLDVYFKITLTKSGKPVFDCLKI